MTSKIAPDVKRCIDIAWESTLDDSEVSVKAADRQLRALRAAVKAAQAFRLKGRTVRGFQLDGVCLQATPREHAELVRALDLVDRLSRASRPRNERGMKIITRSPRARKS
jgi:hypothetical protein